MKIEINTRGTYWLWNIIKMKFRRTLNQIELIKSATPFCNLG